MRVLKPEIARERKENILNWVVYKYVTTGKPISSEVISENGDFNVSSATIRSILKELEEEGCLAQVHTSGGRVPSDKGYRSYVNSVLRIQNLAETEKERLESEYDRRVEQLDYFLKHTSKLIADMSSMAGFTMFSDIMSERLKRLDIIKVSNKNYLLIIVTDTGIIKHMPFGLESGPDKAHLRALVSNINKKFKDLRIAELKGALQKEFPSAKDELTAALFQLLDRLQREEDSLYLDGISSIYENMEDASMEEIRSIARLLEEKEKFSHMLRERLRDCVSKSGHPVLHKDGSRRDRAVEVSIGSENSVKEFRNFSLVSSSYCLKDKAVGLVGVIGYKRMEYPKVISIVDTVSSMMEDMLSQWEELGSDDDF